MNKDKDRDRALRIVRQEGPVGDRRKEAGPMERRAWLLALGCISLFLWVLILNLLDVAGVL